MFDRTIPFKFICLRLLQVVLAVSIAMGVTVGKDFTLEARQAVFGQRQIQFYIPYSGSTPIVLPPVLLVAHNAGDQESTARRASKHDAAGMEIDVHLVDGMLYAAHSAPSELMPMRAWQAPSLREAWQYSSNAKVLKLDLKSTSQPALDALVRFIEARPSEQQIMIVSSNADALAYLDTELPESLGLLSLSSGADIDALLEHKGRVDGIDGISIPGWTLTAGRIVSLKEHGYLIDAWTVNDIEQLVDLAALGVDIITTDNLAFFDMALDTPKEEPPGL
ncbi:MAG TPA: glycerophosphodiester phosphodiesterase [Thermomicrobiales bacterium]|nr:glycerophosphodiester phosphodiesterase [Thermomicrobiales bacterium]